MKIGARIDSLQRMREEKRRLEEEIKRISREMTDAERELIREMDMEGLTKSTGSLASVSISTSIKPSVEDWDDFYEFIHRTKMYHLLERRPSVTGCRELFESKGSIPGVVPFQLRRLNLRTNEDSENDS